MSKLPRSVCLEPEQEHLKDLHLHRKSGHPGTDVEFHESRSFSSASARIHHSTAT